MPKTTVEYISELGRLKVIDGSYLSPRGRVSPGYCICKEGLSADDGTVAELCMTELDIAQTGAIARNEAVARLFAASPELFLTSSAVVSEWEACGKVSDQSIADIRDAIAKALEGEIK